MSAVQAEAEHQAVTDTAALLDAIRAIVREMRKRWP